MCQEHHTHRHTPLIFFKRFPHDNTHGKIYKKTFVNYSQFCDRDAKVNATLFARMLTFVSESNRLGLQIILAQTRQLPSKVLRTFCATQLSLTSQSAPGNRNASSNLVYTRTKLSVINHNAPLIAVVTRQGNTNYKKIYISTNINACCRLIFLDIVVYPKRTCEFNRLLHRDKVNVTKYYGRFCASKAAGVSNENAYMR